MPAFIDAATPVVTPDGPVRADALLPGDRVLTRDNGARPVRLIFRATALACNRPDGAGTQDAEAGARAGNAGHIVLVFDDEERILSAGAWRKVAGPAELAGTALHPSDRAALTARFPSLALPRVAPAAPRVAPAAPHVPAWVAGSGRTAAL